MKLSELLGDELSTSLETDAGALREARHATYVLHQNVTYEYSAPVTELRQRLVVLPRHRHGDQHRIAQRFSISACAGAAMTSRNDRFGNAVVRVAAPAVPAAIEFRARAVVRRTPHVDSPTAWTGRTAATSLVAPDEAIRDAASPLRALDDPAERAAAISTFVHHSIAYRHDVTSVRTTAADAWALRAGVCQDMAHVMLAMCAACDLPARYVSGHLVGDGASHAWVEVHDERRGRVLSFDPTHDRQTDLRYLVTAVGRDYRDVAPMSGTYSSRGGRGRLSVNKQIRVTQLA